MQKHHCELLDEPDRRTAKPVSQPFFNDIWPASKCLLFTKKVSYDLVVQDKEPLALFERQGFCCFLSSSALEHFPWLLQ
jgi:hypothetical protein